MTDTAHVICLYFGTPGECQNCGGSVYAEGEDGFCGPFEGDPRYCSEDCFADAQEFQQRQARYWATEWCPTCGFDRHEHAPDCTATSGTSTIGDPTIPSEGGIGPEGDAP